MNMLKLLLTDGGAWHWFMHEKVHGGLHVAELWHARKAYESIILQVMHICSTRLRKIQTTVINVVLLHQVPPVATIVVEHAMVQALAPLVPARSSWHLREANVSHSIVTRISRLHKQQGANVLYA